MKICRFKNKQNEIRLGLATDDAVLDLTVAGITSLTALLENDDALGLLKKAEAFKLPRVSLVDVQLCAPVEQQEVWAAGVTYLRSKKARMEESNFSATAYDRVYEAPRPELFFKALAEKVVATGESVGIRHDAKWNVPEPELALVFNSMGRLVGHTIGNDMSSRDIEGENLLYLPQAKTYHRSCALGPWIKLGADEATARGWKINLAIRRGGQTAFADETTVGQIKRTFQELADYLFRCQVFPHGVVLLTGTGLVPPDGFTLQEKDEVEIEITELGVLRNPVMVV